MFKQVQSRIIFLIFLIALVFLTGLTALRVSEQRRINNFLAEQVREKKILLKNIVNVTGRNLEQPAYDNTMWDEMVHFVSTGDVKWAQFNIDAALNTFNFQAAFVYRPDMSLVYSVNSLQDTALKTMPVDIKKFGTVLQSRHFMHFFLETSSGLMEFRTAPIQSSSDLQRKGVPAGYFIVGRLWSKSFLGELSALAASKIDFIKADTLNKNTPKFRKTDYLVIATIDLKDWQNKTIKTVRSVTESSIIKQSMEAANEQLIVSLVFTFIILGSMLGFLLFRVSRPLRLISHSLAEEDPEVIEELADEETEYGSIARMMTEFFNQKKKLTREISEREQAERAAWEGEKRYRQSVENSPNPIFTVMKNGVVLTWNNACRDVFKYSAEDIIGQHFRHLFLGMSDTNSIDNIVERVFNGESISSIELYYLCKDGDERYMISSVYPLLNIDGEVESCVFANTDLTGEKKAERELKWNEALLRTMTNSSPLAFYVVNNDTDDILYFNHRFCQIWNIEHIEAKMKQEGMKNNDVIFECIPVLKDVDAYAESCKPLQQRDNRITIEDEIPFKDGRIIRRFSCQIRNDADIYMGRFYIFEDITLRKNSEMALQKSEEKNRAMLTAIPDLIFYLNSNYVCLDYHMQNEHHFPLKPAMYVNHHIREVMNNQLADTFCRALNNAKSGSQAELIEYEMPDANGSNYYLEARIVQTGLGDYLIMMRDITDRKSAEQKLELAVKRMERSNSELKIMNFKYENEILEHKAAELALQATKAQQKSILDNIPYLAWLSDNNLKFIAVNRPLINFVGKSEEFILGQAGENVWPADYAGLYQKNDMDIISQGRQQYIEASLATEKGTAWFEIFKNPIYNEEGQVVGITALAREITERKLAEYEIRKAKESADQANRSKSEFLANMSHEIRTPMNAVLGFAELLKGHVEGAKYQNYLDGIQTSGKNLLQLINDILDLSKIEAGKLAMRYEPMSIHIICRELNQIFSLKCAEKGISLLFEISPLLPAGMLLDELRIRQVLLNLIGNSVKFTEAGAIKVMIASEPSRRGNNDEIDLNIIIADSGVGIPLDQQELIFEAFSQQEGQSTRKYGGTGLGLTITKRLVEMMNGSISVVSTPGKGSEFTVHLNNVRLAAVQQDKANDDDSLENISFTHAVILLAEDIESNRAVVKGFLEEYDFDLIDAHTGKEALDLAKSYKPDLVLMDIQMPVMDGNEAVAILKADEELKSIPVIALTASPFKKENDPGQELFDGLLNKPLSRRELVNTLMEFLPHKKSTSDSEMPSVSQNASLKGFDFADLNDVIIPQIVLQELNGRILAQWEEVQAGMFIDDITAFAEQIKELGEMHQIEVLSRYGSDLYEYADSFKIEKITRLMTRFPEMVNKLAENININ
ncbi:MAG: PAS domain S-box protein [Methanococcaceae archaeon]